LEEQETREMVQVIDPKNESIKAKRFDVMPFYFQSIQHYFAKTANDMILNKRINLVQIQNQGIYFTRK
jgi:hypothetical protein